MTASAATAADAPPSAGAIDARALSRLRWRCRRGLLENDLLLDRLLSRPQPLTAAEARGLEALMELADNDLLDVLLGRREPEGTIDLPEVRQVVGAIRAVR
ncbi:MAG: succinate dehydrogenase assembly factor 2 [Caldimonas sp.]